VFADRPAQGLPGSSSLVAMEITLVIGLALVLLRRRLLDPRRLGRRHLPILWMALPALMLLGTVGVLTGMPVWAGSALLVVGAAVLVVRVPEPTTAMPVHRGHFRLAVLICALVLAAAAVSAVSASQALFHGPELPPPSPQR
jgi:predicted membrane channel-forming protein YqfA (hemolysin III family)